MKLKLNFDLFDYSRNYLYVQRSIEIIFYHTYLFDCNNPFLAQHGINDSYLMLIIYTQLYRSK